MKTIERHYLKHCTTRSDISEHMPILRSLSSECHHVTEFGVRSVISTWALLAGLMNRGVATNLIGIDIVRPRRDRDLRQLEKAASGSGVKFVFVQADDRCIEIEPTDMLFIDTLHTYKQLKEELARHAEKVKKYIVLHDTETYGTLGENGETGINPAIEEFLAENRRWRVLLRLTNCNGLTILGH